MPVVPFAPMAKKAQGPMPDEEWALMAAAQMHSEGRLIEKTSWSDNDVTGGIVTDKMADDFSDNDISSLFEQNNDTIDNKGVTFSRKAYDRFKSTIDKLGDDYESIPSTKEGDVHIRRKPKVW